MRTGPADGGGVAPSLDALVEALPPENRRNIEELFRGKFIAVRRIRPEQLR